MSGELEAAGAAATAGLAAAAIEGREAHKRGAATHCANCAAALTGLYCAQCGQAAHVHRSLWHVFEEFLHGLLHFDTRAWRTFPMLVGRPGTLTRNYIHGQRARYLSPIAVFLFIVFLMFFVFALVPPNVPGLSDARPLSELSREDLSERLEEIREAEVEIARSREEIEKNDAPQQAAMALAVGQRKVERERLAIEAELARRDGTPLPAGAETLTEEEKEGRLGLAEHLGLTRPGMVLDDWSEPDGFGKKLREKLSNPELLLYKISQAAYKFSFLLVPISLPFVALLFLWKRGLTLYDHVVFALYSLSFMSLLFIAMSLVGLSKWTGWANGWLFWAIPTHMYFQLKGTYALGWFSALWRTFFLLIFAFTALIIFIILIFVIGALG